MQSERPEPPRLRKSCRALHSGLQMQVPFTHVPCPEKSMIQEGSLRRFCDHKSGRIRQIVEKMFRMPIKRKPDCMCAKNMERISKEWCPTNRYTPRKREGMGLYYKLLMPFVTHMKGSLFSRGSEYRLQWEQLRRCSGGRGPVSGEVLRGKIWT
jgi:hypothetical protein